MLILPDMPYDHPVVVFFMTLLIGLCIGSFLNVVIYRLPLMLKAAYASTDKQASPDPEQAPETQSSFMTLAWPGSHCPACKRPVRPAENIPVLSYLYLLGRCAGCKAHIPVRYPLVEVASAVVTVATASHFGPTMQTVGTWLLLWTLIALFFIDLNHQLLPDCLTQPLLWLGLFFNSFAAFVPLREAFWGVVAGYAALWSIYWICFHFTGKEGMGYGDFKLLAALGAWFGWGPLLHIIVLASTGAAVVGLWQIKVRHRDPGQPMAFGPYLIAAGVAALVWKEQRWLLL